MSRLIQHGEFLSGCGPTAKKSGRRIVIIGAAQVFMAWPGLLGFPARAGLPIQRVLQNRSQALIGEGLELQGALAGGFQTFVGVGFGQAQNAQTGAVTHLRMRLASPEWC